MTCDTIIGTDDKGMPLYKKKRVFNTLEEAIAHAKKQNAMDNQLQKVVSYKCNYCQKYHVGRNGKLIKDKDKTKYKSEVYGRTQFKIVGKINLNNLR